MRFCGPYFITTRWLSRLILSSQNCSERPLSTRHSSSSSLFHSPWPESFDQITGTVLSSRGIICAFYSQYDLFHAKSSFDRSISTPTEFANRTAPGFSTRTCSTPGSLRHKRAKSVDRLQPYGVGSFQRVQALFCHCSVIHAVLNIVATPSVMQVGE